MKKYILLILSGILLSSTWQAISSNEPSFAKKELEESNINSTIINFNVDGFYHQEVETSQGDAWTVKVPGGASLLEEGNPDLNKVSASIIIPDDAQMSYRILSSEYMDFTDIDIAPSKGNLSRMINPDDIDRQWSETYLENTFFPGELVSLGDPYILRDYRGLSVSSYPFQYNPVTKVLRVYTEIVVEVYENGSSNRSVKVRNNNELTISKEYKNIYDSHFINSSSDTRFGYVVDQGNMLVVSYGDFMDEMQPFVDWKNMMGIPTEMVNVSSIGSNSTSIKSYIEDYYNDNGLTFVLLVGDITQIPSPSLSGSASDPSYGFIEGGSNDFYAEVIVGRFSANSPAQLTTQIDRSIDYERYPQAGADWYDNALGVASNQGPGMNGYTDDDFNDWLWNSVLSSFTYDSYQGIYDPNGTDSQGINAINSGVSLINYTGHGSISSWGNGASLSTSQVNSLANNNKLPFVITVGCNVGEFNNSTECFAEAWLRSTNGGEPTGAIAHFGSTISQSWEPPMHGQWAMNKIITESYSGLDGSPPVGHNTRTIGGIATNGCLHMNDAQGSSGINETKYWTLFGDPSISIRTDAPSALTVFHSNIILLGEEEYVVDVGINGALVAISKDGELISSAYSEGGVAVLNLGEASNVVGSVDLVVTGFNKIPYETELTVLTPDGAYVVLNDVDVSLGDDNMITAGEFLDVSVTMENIGSEDASDIYISLSSDDEYINIIDGSETLSTLGSESSATVEFTFQVSSGAPYGYPFTLLVEATSDGETWTSEIQLAVGSLVEGFESGDLASYSWEYGGMSDWEIEMGEAADGLYSVRSGYLDNAPSGGNVTSELSIVVDVVADGAITFDKKVSCEDVGSSSGAYYDYLAFYIDGVEQSKWAGEINWSSSSFNVSAGEHTFTWVYNKDQGVVAGDDAVWIDNVVFPPCTLPSDSIAGDLNYDGMINVLDVILMVNMILGLSEPNYSVADMNQDGMINVLDIVLVVNEILDS